MSYNAIFDTRGEYYCDDARKINPDNIPDFDLVCAGFPCQSYPEKTANPEVSQKSQN